MVQIAPGIESDDGNARSDEPIAHDAGERSPTAVSSQEQRQQLSVYGIVSMRGSRLQYDEGQPLERRRGDAGVCGGPHAKRRQRDAEHDEALVHQHSSFRY